VGEGERRGEGRKGMVMSEGSDEQSEAEVRDGSEVKHREGEGISEASSWESPKMATHSSWA
jgi:hypothetical protein